MKATRKLASLASIALFLACLAPANADPAQAELDGLRIGRSEIGSLYQLRLIDSGIATAGSLLVVHFDVQAGVDYVFCTGKDALMADIDLMIYSHVGNLIKKDVTKQARGAVQWRSDYSGTATAYVQIKRTHSAQPGSYAAYLGVLEIPRQGPAADPNKSAP